MDDGSVIIVEDQRDPGFFSIDNEVLREYKVGPFAFTVYAVICSHTGKNSKGSSYPSLKTIGEEAGMSKPSVILAIKKLEGANLIRVTKQKMQGTNENAANIYTLLKVRKTEKKLPESASEVVSQVDHVVNNIDNLGGKPRLLQVVSHVYYGGKPRLQEEDRLKNTDLKKEEDPQTPEAGCFDDVMEIILPEVPVVVEDNSFQAFKEAYPINDNWPDGAKAWKQAKLTADEIAAIMRVLKPYPKSSIAKEEKSKVKSPGPWLRARGWESDVPFKGLEITRSMADQAPSSGNKQQPTQWTPDEILLRPARVK